MSSVISYPGKIPDEPMQLWFSQAAEKAGFGPYVVRDGDKNPCVALYGAGPAGERCKSCRLFIRRQKGKVYFKCELRGITNGPATDHRANWPACKRYVKAQ